MGNVVDEKTRGLEGATIQLINSTDSTLKKSTVSDKDGAFEISQVPFGYYRLKISYTGMQQLVLDSFHFRAER
ncbi:MAG: carboxypeptidase regulatory-like domain-containing protein, partial [Flavisolibacter sp.]